MVVNPKVIIGVTTGAVAFIAGIVAACKLGSDEKQNDESPKQDNTREFNRKVNVSDVVNESSAQAEAEFINTLNTIRLNELLKKLSEIKGNETNAGKEIAQFKAEISKILESNRGGQTGMHGFIGESCQVHIANVKSFIRGEDGIYVLLDDNSMTDYRRGMQLIQQKACQSDNHLGLDHVKKHMEKYLEFLKEHGIYQIPKDFYKKYKRMLNTSYADAMKFRKEDLRLWRFVHKFSEENPDVGIEPMEVTYAEIQAGNANDTVHKVEKETKEAFEEQKHNAKLRFSPTIKEAIKISAISGTVEGICTTAFSIGGLLIDGKKIRDLDKEDLKFILKQFAYGFIRGFSRGSIVYALTNLLKIPATIASTLTTALFVFIRNTYSLVKKRISQAEYIKDTIWDIVEVVLSAVGAYIGKRCMKKHPMIGSLVGSIIAGGGINLTKKFVYA